MGQLMLGNEAVARGIYEAGCRNVFSYPGTPSTEITEYAALYNEIVAEWSPNEKVALEAAFGASVMGARAFCAMKHVGLNVAADPLFTAAYTGVNGGLVIAVADDPGMHSSQNEQDTRSVAIAAKVPVLEPSDSAECLELTILAFEISERFDIPVILRLTTRVAHSRSLVETGEPKPKLLKEYVKDPQKYVMIPAFARERRVSLEQRFEALEEYAEGDEINQIEPGEGLGIITAGVCYQYAKEAAPKTSGYLKLRMLNPLPKKRIADFAAQYKQTVVIEELDPVIENFCLENGVKVEGRALFSGIGELSQSEIARALKTGEPEFSNFGETVPARPPALCAGCPHRGVFYLLSKMKLVVSGDIGCYALGASPPLSAVDTTLCMGASVSGLHGMLKARPEMSDKAVAVIGDSTFMHSGITGLIDIVYNQSNATVLILDNSITGMTGHQQNPSTGFNLRGDPAPFVDLETLCRACGVKRVVVCDPYDLERSEKTIREELAAGEPSVIIMRRPCVLLKNCKRQTPFSVDQEKCIGCRACLRVGCPAIEYKDKKANIDVLQCSGCSVCAGVCPVDAIERGSEQ